MLELSFWGWLITITVIWLVLSVPLGLFLGRVCALNRWEDDE